jgi:Polyketide cyclase / dehydrase and lipid transport
MSALEGVDLTFFENAPRVVHRGAHVAAPRDRVFAAVANDPAGWGRWFPGFSDDGRWETPAPHGVGSVRTVRAFGVRYRETILAWDEGERWAFRVDEVSVPLFKAFAEDYRLADEGSGTRPSWTVAVRTGPGLGVGAPLLPGVFGLILRRAATRLARVA